MRRIILATEATAADLHPSEPRRSCTSIVDEPIPAVQEAFVTALVKEGSAKAAAAAVHGLDLAAEFPTAEADYRASVAAKLLAKGKWAVAATFVGDDVALQGEVRVDSAQVQRLGVIGRRRALTEHRRHMDAASCTGKTLDGQRTASPLSALLQVTCKTGNKACKWGVQASSARRSSRQHWQRATWCRRSTMPTCSGLPQLRVFI